MCESERRVLIREHRAGAERDSGLAFEIERGLVFRGRV